MRAEVDLENDKGLLCHGMYGYVTIQLPSSPGAMRIPTSALTGPVTDGMAACLPGQGRGREGCAKCSVGRDDAEQIEVLEGLSAEDDVAVTHGTELAEGMHVTTTPASAKPHLEAHKCRPD